VTKIVGNDGELLGIVDSLHTCVDPLEFITDPKQDIQVAKFLRQTGDNLKPHAHLYRPRVISQTQEVLFVFRGLLKLVVYGNDRRVVHQQHLRPGDFYTYLAGGVGYEVIQGPAAMLEVKAGSYKVKSDSEDRELIK